MPENNRTIPAQRFEALLQRPVRPGDGAGWGFVVLPREVSAALPRRGRTTVQGTFGGQAFCATLEPDGQLSHWLKVDDALRQAAGARYGAPVALEIAPTVPEPEPLVPPDLQGALDAAPQARAGWQAATTLARVDWIAWIESAKQARTRTQRIGNACDMLAKGKLRVCCFDPSGFYSKALSAPKADGTPGQPPE
jgi:hypothetical protein